MAEENHLSRWEHFKQCFYGTIEKQVITDKPHRIALGCALGIGVNFIPTLGLGFVFSFLLAIIFRANRATAAGTSLVFAPLIPIMYALNLVIGGLVLTPVSGKENIVEFILSQYALILTIGNFKDKMFSFLEFFGSTFILGAAINAAIFGFAIYLFVSHIVKKKRD